MKGGVVKQGFEELDCYKLALEVFKEAYATTKRLPTVERYNLSDQLRRAATSATLNIAEGYGRYHYLDKIRFYYIARGSLSEILAAFIDCHAAGYTSDKELASQRDLCHRSLQALNGFIRYTYRQRQGQKEYGDRALREPDIKYSISLHPIDDLPAADSLVPLDPELEYPGSTNPESTKNGG
jgi:four helix bundle protein